MLCSVEGLSQMQQFPSTNLDGTPFRDTSGNASNNSEWRNERARLTFRRAYSDAVYVPDTTLHTFHRRPFIQPWHGNLGNHGSAAFNWFFTPEFRVGPTLGYHVFDVYRYQPDSLYYYNTNRPYSNFIFQLGAKLEQTAQIMHTQNISPNWNIALQYRKLTSPGAYIMQRTNHDNAWITTNFQSPRLRYKLYGAIVYNQQQQDENGGITNERLLDSASFGDRRTIPVRFDNARIGTVGDNVRSGITNTQRDVSALLQHSYTFGPIDTLYNEDSTRYSFELKPKFGITHRLHIGYERHSYRDMRSDSLRYVDFFNQPLRREGQDSVVSVQRVFTFDNRIMLNSFIGKKENLLSFSAGLGTRNDKFRTHYGIGTNANNVFSNYLIGELKKEILRQKQWFYNASAMLYLTGTPGNSLLNVEAGKDLGYNWGSIKAGFRQSINNAPYTYEIYQNQYDTMLTSFGKESITQLSGTYDNYRWGVSGGVRNYLINNYIFINEQQRPDQSSETFNITQVWLNKVFRLGKFVLDNELVYQQKAGNAPVNIPALMGRHQLSIETNLFKSSLNIASGVEVRYHSAFTPMAYSTYLNRFYYQNAYYLTNMPSGAVFFNFSIKQFRAYIMGDQIQQLFIKGNVINAPGYPMPDFAIRFGFSWTLIN